MRNDKNILETRVVRGYTINVFTDPEPPKPDECSDQPVYMVANHDQFCHATKNGPTGQSYKPADIRDWYDDHYEDDSWCMTSLHIWVYGDGVCRKGNQDPDRVSAFIAVHKETFIKYAMVPTEKHGDTELIQKEIDAYNWDKLIDSVIAEWNMYLAREVLAFEIIDVNGRVIENLYGYYGTEAETIREALDYVPDYDTPPRQECYVWRELATVEGETSPQLLTPWSDPMVYEYSANWQFIDAESAEKWKEETAPDEEWWLCKVTTTPLELYRSKKEA